MRKRRPVCYFWCRLSVVIRYHGERCFCVRAFAVAFSVARMRLVAGTQQVVYVFYTLQIFQVILTLSEETAGSCTVGATGTLHIDAEGAAGSSFAASRTQVGAPSTTYGCVTGNRASNNTGTALAISLLSAAAA